MLKLRICINLYIHNSVLWMYADLMNAWALLDVLNAWALLTETRYDRNQPLWGSNGCGVMPGPVFG